MTGKRRMKKKLREEYRKKAKEDWKKEGKECIDGIYGK